jgi:hypothetical protein
MAPFFAKRLRITAGSIGSRASPCRVGFAEGTKATRFASVSVSFKLAVDRTNISVDNGITMQTFHEQRSLSERIYEEQGIKTQQLQGHSSDRMTVQYHNDRGLDWVKVKV